MKKQSIRPNVHISYDQQLQPYHWIVAELVCKYTYDSASVLDIGCGVGYTLSEIQKRKPLLKLFAADIDDELLAITNERVKLSGQHKIATVEDLFSIGRTFDVIVMSHVLEHTYRPLDILRGIMEMLHSNGIAVLAVPNPVRLLVFLGNIFKKHYVNRGHVYAWDRSHWINFLENIAGLDVLCYSQDYFPLPKLHRSAIGRSLEIQLAQVFPWLTFSNIAVVRKIDKN